MPAASSSAGEEAVDLAASAGLILDDWQRDCLIDSLGERADGRWAAFEVGIICPRQNGKGALLEARELAGLFLFDEQLIMHSSHEFKTSSEAFRRIWHLIQNTPDLERRVKQVYTGHGQEGIELRGGQRLRFVARSSGSGRGFTGDLVILDESFNLPSVAIEAMVPTLSARPNPQLWYTSSAPLPGDESAVLRRLCKRGREGQKRLAYLEYCAPDEAWDDLDNVGHWVAANPGLGIRITAEFIAALERPTLSDEGFARERLGLWRDDDDRVRVFTPEQWQACAEWPLKSQLVDDTCFAFDVSMDRAWSTIASAGTRADGRPQVEVIEHKQGTGWVAKRLRELVASWHPPMVVCDPTGPAGALLSDLDGVDVTLMGTREAAQACGMFYDDVVEGRLRHLGQDELSLAVADAEKRQVGDAWLWSRKNSMGVISPLVAVTLARWASANVSVVDVAANVW